MSTAVDASSTQQHLSAGPRTTDHRIRHAAHPVRLAATDALVLPVGMIPFGVVVGITAATLQATDPAQPATGAGALGVSGLLYAGTSQMAGFAQLAAVSAPLAVIATMVIANTRHHWLGPRRSPRNGCLVPPNHCTAGRERSRLRGPTPGRRRSTAPARPVAERTRPVRSATRCPAARGSGVGKEHRRARSHARAMASGADPPWAQPFPYCGTVTTVHHRQAPRRETIMSTTGKPSAENAAHLKESANAAAAQAADAVKTGAAKAEDAIEASVEQIRELNEQAIKAARAAGQRALDAYQAALESVVDAEKNLAGGSHLDWFTTLVNTQAEFTQRLGTIFLTAAREQLK
jgi:hypothetical protein